MIIYLMRKTKYLRKLVNEKLLFCKFSNNFEFSSWKMCYLMGENDVLGKTFAIFRLNNKTIFLFDQKIDT